MVKFKKFGRSIKNALVALCVVFVTNSAWAEYTITVNQNGGTGSNLLSTLYAVSTDEYIDYGGISYYELCFADIYSAESIGDEPDLSCVLAGSYYGPLPYGDITNNSYHNYSLPTKTGYKFNGYWSAASGGTQYINAKGQALGDFVAYDATNDFTIYAQWTAKSITCSAGYYLPANSETCTACPAGKYCAGGTWTYDGSEHGATACATDYTSLAGAISIAQCYKTENNTCANSWMAVNAGDISNATGVSYVTSSSISGKRYLDANGDAGAWVPDNPNSCSVNGLSCASGYKSTSTSVSFSPSFDMTHGSILGTGAFQIYLYPANVNIQGISRYSSTTSSTIGSTRGTDLSTSDGNYCWCKVFKADNNPISSDWIYAGQKLGVTTCADMCINQLGTQGSAVQTAFLNNASTTQYSCEQAAVYTLTFDKNGGTGGTDYLYWDNSGVYTDASGTQSWHYSTDTISVPTRTGYTFIGYYDGDTQIFDLDGSDTDPEGNISPGHLLQSENLILTAHWAVHKFSVTTSATDSFQFKISAVGTFYVDCGNGGTLEDSNGNNLNGVITRSDTTSATYTCKWGVPGAEQTIRFGGAATNYSTSTSAAISFNISNSSEDTNASKVASITGDLTKIFGNVQSGRIPRFYNTFRGTNIDSIPSGLFASINTSSATDTSTMFRGTFFGCNNLTTVPSGLFDSIDTSSATDTSNMFYRTFFACSKLANIGNSNYVPDNFLSGVTGSSAATGMFTATGLDSSCPAGTSTAAVSQTGGKFADAGKPWCFVNTITIRWTGVQTPGTGTTFTQVSQQNGGDGYTYTSAVNYGEDIITPMEAVTVTGQTFLGWKFEK